MTDTVNNIVPREELHRFMIRCMEAVGTRTEHASGLADVLVAADYTGHKSHGLRNLGQLPFPFSWVKTLSMHIFFRRPYMDQFV